jgi:hypothetical protein
MEPLIVTAEFNYYPETVPTFSFISFNGIAGAASIIALGYAVLADRKRRSAVQAAAAAESRVFTIIAGTAFALVGRLAYELIIATRAKDWNSAAQLLAQMASTLGDAKGKWPDKLNDSEKVAMSGIESQIAQLSGIIPTKKNLTEAEIAALCEQCNRIILVVRTISGRLERQFIERGGDQ